VKRLRTLRRFVPFLIGLFMVAQLAGVVSSEEMHPDAGLAVAAADPTVDHAAHQHGHAGENHHHGHHGTGGAIDHGLAANGVAGQCCALHAWVPLRSAFRIRKRALPEAGRGVSPTCGHNGSSGQWEIGVTSSKSNQRYQGGTRER